MNDRVAEDRPTSPLRIGLLGASKIAPHAMIAPARDRADVTIQAVAAREPDRARAYAETHGVAAISDSYAALLARDDVDLVYIALPPAGHLEWAVKAVEAGKAVLCEKPFAMDGAEAQAMVDAAAAAGCPLIEALHYRFHQAMRRAEALIRDGALGRLTHAKAYFNVPIARQPEELRWIRGQGGGALMDLGCYPLHALRTLLGAEPQVASASAVFEDGVDASLDARLVFPGDVECDLACSMIAERVGCRLTLHGERGSLQFVNFVAPQMGGSLTLAVGDATTAFDIAGPSTYAAQLDHVVAVMDGRAAPLTGGHDAVANMAAIDRIYAAAGRPSVTPAEA